MRLLSAICRPVGPVPGIPTQLDNERARAPPLVVYYLVLLSLAQLFSYCGQISGSRKDCGGLCQEVERVGRSWGRETWWIAIELRSEHDYGGIRLI